VMREIKAPKEKASKIKQADRVSFTYSIKVPWKVEYSSETISASYSSDVGPKETSDEAFARVYDFVMEKVLEVRDEEEE